MFTRTTPPHRQPTFGCSTEHSRAPVANIPPRWGGCGSVGQFASESSAPPRWSLPLRGLTFCSGFLKANGGAAPFPASRSLPWGKTGGATKWGAIAPEGGRSGEGAERLRTGGTARSPPVMFVGGPTKSEQTPTPFLAIRTIRWQSKRCRASLPVEQMHPYGPHFSPETSKGLTPP